MSFAKLITEDIRLVTLRTLLQDADYSHNEYVLVKALEMMGHKISRDRLRTELAWLAEQDLTAISDAAGVQVVRLTARGADTADGRTIVPGVKRPEPEL